VVNSSMPQLQAKLIDIARMLSEPSPAPTG
jgi:hypothetical protein